MLGHERPVRVGHVGAVCGVLARLVGSDGEYLSVGAVVMLDDLRLVVDGALNELVAIGIGDGDAGG